MVWDVAKAFPWGFAIGVVGPVLAALRLGFSAFSGFENLSHQYKNERQSDRIEEGVLGAQAKLNTLLEYQGFLAAAGKRDDVLIALINQYEQLKRAVSPAGTSEANGERLQIASTILQIIQQDILRVATRPDLPGRPLMLGIAPNTFRVILSVPMRRPPDLTFTGLPEGTRATVSDVSEVSFTVTFWPPEPSITTFGFTADADL